MKLTFLGSGGGRFSTISQRRMTGGFRIDNLNGIMYLLILSEDKPDLSGFCTQFSS